MSKKVHVVCTGNDSHPQKLLGILVDNRAPLDGTSLLSLADDLPGQMGEGLRQMVAEQQALPLGIYFTSAKTRVTARGSVRRVEYPLEVRQRADGGRTFDVECTRCRRKGHRPRYVPIRDDSAEKMFDSGVSHFDISTA